MRRSLNRNSARILKEVMDRLEEEEGTFSMQVVEGRATVIGLGVIAPGYHDLDKALQVWDEIFQNREMLG